MRLLDITFCCEGSSFVHGRMFGRKSCRNFPDERESPLFYAEFETNTFGRICGKFTTQKTTVRQVAPCGEISSYLAQTLSDYRRRIRHSLSQRERCMLLWDLLFAVDQNRTKIDNKLNLLCARNMWYMCVFWIKSCIRLMQFFNQ